MLTKQSTIPFQHNWNIADSVENTNAMIKSSVFMKLLKSLRQKTTFPLYVLFSSKKKHLKHTGLYYQSKNCCTVPKMKRNKLIFLDVQSIWRIESEILNIMFNKEVKRTKLLFENVSYHSEFRNPHNPIVRILLKEKTLLASLAFCKTFMVTFFSFSLTIVYKFIYDLWLMKEVTITVLQNTKEAKSVFSFIFAAGPFKCRLNS